MNRRKAKLVADFIESGKYKFRMRTILEKDSSGEMIDEDTLVVEGVPKCKTAACIAGIAGIACGEDIRLGSNTEQTSMKHEAK